MCPAAVLGSPSRTCSVRGAAPISLLEFVELLRRPRRLGLHLAKDAGLVRTSTAPFWERTRGGSTGGTSGPTISYATITFTREHERHRCSGAGSDQHKSIIRCQCSSSPPSPSPTPGQCFIHVADAVKLWKQLCDRGTAGVGPIAEQNYGLREFVRTNPDGNRVRLGSHTG